MKKIAAISLMAVLTLGAAPTAAASETTGHDEPVRATWLCYLVDWACHV